MEMTGRTAAVCLASLLAGCALVGPEPPYGGDLPSEEDLVVTREGYQLGYRYSANQPAWVRYTLRDADLASRVRRSGDFREDPAIPPEHRVRPSDYRRTGYDKGHMAPAADMARTAKTMSESFYMSNMSPQRPECNRRTWRELEELVRKWAAEFGELDVVTGPVLTGGEEVIGRAECPVSVPVSYYKAVYAPSAGEMIAFVVPNSVSTNGPAAFAVSIDEVERLTGLDIFRDDAAECAVSTNFWFGTAP